MAEPIAKKILKSCKKRPWEWGFVADYTMSSWVSMGGCTKTRNEPKW